MRNFLLIFIVSFCFCLNLNSQPVKNSSTKKNDWFKNSAIEIKTIAADTSKNIVDYGSLKLVGWSKNGLIAYIFSPLTTIACEREERFYIYDLVKNQFIWQMFACTVNWSDPNDKYASECIAHLVKTNFIPANSSIIKPINTKVVEKDSLNKIFILYNKRQKLITTIPKKYPFCEIHQALGYITSPLDKKLSVLIFPSSCSVESVFVYGIKALK